MSEDLTLELAGPEQADDLWHVVHAAFAARPPVVPPPAALAETPQSIAAAVRDGLAVLARVDGAPAGAIVISTDGRLAGLHRVSVHPDYQRHGIATAMVDASLEVLADEGFAELELMAREEFPQVIAWWQRRGFHVVEQVPHGVLLRRQVPVALDVPTADDMTALGRRLAPLLRAGDLIIATGDLGAGKTTFTQGLGAGLEVDGPVISPTFVLTRVHRPLGERPGLVHVDAYRLGGYAEVDDLDLDETMATSVTLVEWGAGLAEGLASDRLEIDIRRSADPDDEARRVYLTPIGPRWAGVDLAALREERS